MATVIPRQPNLPIAVPAVLDQILGNSRSDLLPIIHLSTASTEEAFQGLAEAAQTIGVALINGLSFKAPISAIQRLFDALYADPALVNRVNATYPKRGVFKSASLDPAKPSGIDQKVTIDLSVARLAKIQELDPKLVGDLGEDFAEVLSFYTTVENDILAPLMEATSRIAGVDLLPLHASKNNNLRLIDYYADTSSPAPRCGEHRDYGTFTVVFQDSSVGGLEFEIDGKWIPVPADVDAVVSWGWCGAILSNDGVHAAKHRVQRTEPAAVRRTTAVVFAAPDLDVVLKPVNGTGEPKMFARRIMDGHVTVGDFKEVMGKRWRHREGNEGGEAVVDGAQDREVVAFVRGA